jgi:hypothetical protein
VAGFKVAVPCWGRVLFGLRAAVKPFSWRCFHPSSRHQSETDQLGQCKTPRSPTDDFEESEDDPSDLSLGSAFRALCRLMDRRQASGLPCHGVDLFVQRVAGVASYPLPVDFPALGELQELLPEITVEDRLSVSPSPTSRHPFVHPDGQPLMRRSLSEKMLISASSPAGSVSRAAMAARISMRLLVVCLSPLTDCVELTAIGPWIASA